MMNKHMGFWMSCAGALVFLGACGSTQAVPEVAKVTPSAPVAQEPADPTPSPTTVQQSQPPKPVNGTHRNNPRRMFQLDELQLVKIKIGTHEFNCWVMDTEAKRAEGMMFLKNEDFKDNDSMIFVFKQPQELGFWMQNTLVDLDIAYVNERKTIIRAVTMKALDETSVPSKGPAKYAIEFRGGLFNRIGIRAGQKVEIPATVVAKE